jgi:hypothetical protein
MVLRVTVEIVPFGREKDKYTIHTLEAHNIGKPPVREGRTQRTDERAYEVYDLSKINGDFMYDSRNSAFEGNVTHNRDDGALALVQKMMELYNSQ